MLGDSLTYGHGLERRQALPARLEEALRRRGRDVVVLNHGVSGNRTGQALARLASVLDDKPDIVLVALGVNDSVDYWNNNTAEVERNLDEIVARLKAANVVVWLAGIRVQRRLQWKALLKVVLNSLLEVAGRPPAYHAQTLQYAAKFHRVHGRIATKYGLPFYPDLLQGVDQRLLLPDNIHPDRQGVDDIVARLLVFVIENLDAYAAARTERAARGRDTAPIVS